MSDNPASGHVPSKSSGSKEITAMLNWLPPAAVCETASVSAERLPEQFQDADSVKQYLSKEAVPVLTKALMDLCMADPHPSPAETIPWMIKWLQDYQETREKEGKSG